MEIYSQDEGMHNYAINYLLFLTTVREKHVKMYERFIEELQLYSKAHMSLIIKRVSTHFSVTPIKARENPERIKNNNCQI